jgi:hypothetical protein
MDYYIQLTETILKVGWFNDSWRTITHWFTTIAFTQSENEPTGLGAEG